MVGVDGHARVLDQKVFQRAGLQEDRLAAAAGETGWWGNKPALLQRANVQAEEPALLFVFLIILHPTVWVGVGSGVKGGAGGVADWRAGRG